MGDWEAQLAAEEANREAMADWEAEAEQERRWRLERWWLERRPPRRRTAEMQMGSRRYSTHVAVCPWR